MAETQQRRVTEKKPEQTLPSALTQTQVKPYPNWDNSRSRGPGDQVLGCVYDWQSDVPQDLQPRITTAQFDADS